MELYNKKENPDLKLEEMAGKDLQAEGIDLVGTGVNEDNEFTDASSTALAPTPTSPDPITPPAPPALQNQPVPETPTRSQTPSTSIVPPKKEETKSLETPIQNDPSIKPIRTFKTDAEEAVRYKNVSAVDIAVAEQKKRESNPIEYIEEKQSHPGIIMAVALVIIAVLVGGWFYWFKSTNSSEPKATIPAASVETIIPYAKGSTLAVYPESDPLTLIGAKLSASNPGLGNVYAVVPTLQATSTEPAPITEVLRETHAPSRLLRSLGGEYMIGSYAFDIQSPFFIIKDTFFQNAFAGMLEWEKDMRNDLLPLIRVSYPDETAVTADTDKFDDIVISNIDARVLKNSEGKTILAYAFADPDTFVISTSETALQYVLDRLLTVRSVQ